MITTTPKDVQFEDDLYEERIVVEPKEQKKVAVRTGVESGDKHFYAVCYVTNFSDGVKTYTAINPHPFDGNDLEVGVYIKKAETLRAAFDRWELAVKAYVKELERLMKSSRVEPEQRIVTPKNSKAILSGLDYKVKT